MKTTVEGPSLIPMGEKFPFLALQNQCSWVVGHEIFLSLLRAPTLGMRVLLPLGWNTCLAINFDIEKFRWKTCEVEKGIIILLIFSCRHALMLLGEVWCGWFCTPVCNYKFHAFVIYLHFTFTVSPIGSAFGIKLSIWGGAFYQN